MENFVTFVAYILLFLVFVFFLWLGLGIGLSGDAAFFIACAGTLIVAIVVYRIVKSS